MSDDEATPLDCSVDGVLSLNDENPKRMVAEILCEDAMQYKVTWSGDNGSDRGFHVFDKEPKSGRWQSPHHYTGTNGRYETDGELAPTIGADNANHLGEWIQIELPNAKAIDKYAMMCGTMFSPLNLSDGLPGSWVVLGSMTGENRSWTRVHGAARNQAFWERGAKYVITDVEENQPFFVRSVANGRYLMANPNPDTSMKWCDVGGWAADQRIGNTGNFTITLSGKSDANKLRATWLNPEHHLWRNEYVFPIADRCGTTSLVERREKIAYLAVTERNMSQLAWGNAGWETIYVNTPLPTMPNISSRIRSADGGYLSTRNSVVTPSESVNLAGNAVGGGPTTGKKPEEYHWILETEDRAKAEHIIGASTLSGTIESSTAYKYYRFVFMSTTQSSSINLNHLAITFKDGSSAGSGPRWVEGNWTPTCTSADPTVTVTRNVECKQGSEDVSESLCDDDKPDETSTCDKVYRPPASGTGSGAADIRAFFADWGLIIVGTVVGFIILIVLLQLVN